MNLSKYINAFASVPYKHTILFYSFIQQLFFNMYLVPESEYHFEYDIIPLLNLRAQR